MTLDDHLKTTNKTHLIFDFDGTLLKLVLPWEKAIRGLEKEITALDDRPYRKYHEKKLPFSLLQNYYVDKFGEKALKTLVKNEIEFETKNLKGTILNKELLNIVKNLSGYELFVWSSNTKPTVEGLLKKHGIFNKFKRIITRENVKFLKPEIDGFRLLHDPNVSKEKYLFIGDSEFDKLAAKKAGVDFYFVDFFK